MTIREGYDKSIPLDGVGHHTPSYGTGYDTGRADVTEAFRTAVIERDTALYAAYLLLGEAMVGVSPQMRLRWSQATARWRREYELALEAVIEQ